MVDRVRSEKCTGCAVSAGIRGGAIAGVFSSATVAALNRYHMGFRTSLGVSGKCACAIIPVAFFFSLRAEQALIKVFE